MGGRICPAASIYPGELYPLHQRGYDLPAGSWPLELVVPSAVSQEVVQETCFDEVSVLNRFTEVVLEYSPIGVTWRAYNNVSKSNIMLFCCSAPSDTYHQANADWILGKVRIKLMAKSEAEALPYSLVGKQAIAT